MIDFHTHMFPDKMAPKTIPYLEKVGNTKAYTEGTVNALIQSTIKAGIDISVILPVVTKPSQFHSINQFAVAAANSNPHLISFGGIHPDSNDYKEELREIKAMGMKGIKLHPDYQNAFFNDLKYKRIISYATELDLIISVHAGVDIGYPDPVHCTPQMAKEVLDEVKPVKLVLAHMGGHDLWNDVENILVGENVYFDTGYAFDRIPDEQFLRIVNNHGSDKILFATDSPWGGQKEFIQYLQNMPLSSEEKENIFDKNARKLLTLV